MSNKEKIIGTTQSPSGVITPLVQVERVETQQFTMDGNTVDGISTNHHEASPKKLTTSFALEQAATGLKHALNGLETTVVDIITSPVLSPPIASPTFTDLSKWSLRNFHNDNGSIVCYNRESPSIGQAHARLNQTAFLHRGEYYIDLTLAEIAPGATLTIIDYHDVVIATLTAPRRLRTTFTVDYPGVYYFDLRADNLPFNSSMRITYASVHYVKPEFSSYMEYMSEKMASDGSGFASMEDLNSAISVLNLALRNYIETINNGLEADLRAHQSDVTSNPHGINTEMIRAAKDIHGHKVNDIEGLSGDVMAPLENVLIVVNKLSLDLTRHMEAINPHEINPEMIRASSVDHIHDWVLEFPGLEEAIKVGADDKLVFIRDSISALADQLTLIRENLTITTDMLRVHEQKQGNAHKAVPADFGIVLATSAEAIDGTDEAKYMNPTGVRVAVESWATWKGLDVTRLNPRYVSSHVISMTNPIINIPVTLGAKYQLSLSGDKQYDLRTFTMTHDGTYSNSSKITSKAIIDATLATESGQSVYRFIPTTATTTTVHGTWTLDTTTGSMIGYGAGYVLNASTLLASGIPTHVKSIIAREQPGIVTGMTKLTFTLTGATNANAVIVLDMYELVPLQDHAVAIDANPAGAIIQVYGTAPKKDYSLLDGSILTRALFMGLYNYAVLSGKMITKAQWDTMASASGGNCSYFHSGNGTTTFGLPKRDNSDNINPMIKLKDTYLASPAQVLFEYTWE